MKLLAGGGGKSAAPGQNPMASAAPGNAGPVSSPMTTPQPKDGVTQAATLQVVTAMDVLERVLPQFGSETEEGRDVMKALQLLSKRFGKVRPKAQELQPAEMTSLMGAMPKPSPEAGAMGGGAAPKPAMPMAA